MIKLMTLIKSPASIGAEQFKAYWSGDFFSRLTRLSAVRNHLLTAKHNYALPVPIREERDAAQNKWAGAGCYYFDSRVMAQVFLSTPEYQALLADSRRMMAEVVHLLVDEVWMYNRDPGALPIKGFAFFKRLSHLSRFQALQYYQGPHAAVGAGVNKGRIQRYIQNHVLMDFENPQPYDYDGGPEIWFKSMDLAMDLYGDREGMETLGQDEAQFIQRNDLTHFLAEEELMFEREADPQKRP
jgi:EthD domain-containing protein